MATIYKLPSGSWRVQVRLADQKAIGKTFAAHEDAKAWGRSMEGDEDAIDAFPDAEARRRTVAAAIDAYMLQHTGRDEGVASRLSWWRAEYGRVSLAKFNHPAQIKAALRKLAAAPARRGNGKGKAAKQLDHAKSAATINRNHAAISSVLTWALHEGWTTRNAAKGIPRKREPRGRVRFLTDDERAALLAACDASAWADLGLLVRLALTTGARLSEMLGLQWSDIDLVAGVARVGRTKNDEPRVLPLVASIKTTLEARTTKAGPLFENPNAFRKHWDVAIAAAKIENFRFHDCRHDVASALAMAGASPLEIGDVLGHKSLVMVRRYSHLSTAHKSKLAERVLGGERVK